MADSEVLKKLKDIPFKIQTASLKGRRDVLEEIQNVLSTPGITEPAVRFVCRVLLLTLNRYRDSTSQSYVKSLLSYLSTQHGEWTLKSLLPALLEVSEQLRNIAPSKNTSQTGLYALRWSTVLVEGTLKAPEDVLDYNTLVLAQANLLAVVTAYGDKKKNEKGYSLMHNSWLAMGSDKLSKWVNVLLSQPADSGPQVCVSFSAICRHVKEMGDNALIAPHKNKMLESLTKSLISVKSRPNANYIRACADLLHLLQKADVQETLLPALHKSMLRSPETIIQAVGVVVENLDVHVDGIAVEIGKSLIVNLHSRDEWVRAEALAALGALSRKCSAPEAARALVTHAFAHYNGAEGKLTSSEDKIAVLNGVGELSELAVSAEDRLKLFDEVVTQSARVLDSESHERTLCVALEALYRWIDSLNSPLPEKILQIYKKGLSAKSTTQTVRIAYTSLIARALRRGPAHKAALWGSLLAAADRAAQQPLQHLIVSEGICAMAALAQLDAAQELPACGTAWAALTHHQKHVLLHDRVLAAAPDDVLIQVGLLCRTVLEKYDSVASDQNSPVLKAFILVLLSPVKTVRTSSIEEVKSLLAREDRAILARNLVLKLNEVLEEGKVFAVKEKTPPEDKADVTGKIILDCVQALCSFRDYKVEDAERLALEALPCSHHPLVEAMNNKSWIKLVAYLRLDARRLVTRHLPALRQLYITEFTLTETARNVVSTLVRASPSGAGGAAVGAALEALQRPDLLQVTRDDYFVYLTPPGHLYDKSAVPGNEESREMNLKRESKAYSYKEQLEELQLRRELDEKRLKEGKIKEAPMSAKQKEAMKAQLAKESAIRERLTVLNSGVEKAVQLLEATSRGSVLALGVCARRIVRAVLGALHSPLAAPRLAPAHVQLRLALLPQHPTLADHVARTTLRLFKPQCDLDPSWEEEDLTKATIRTINLVHAHTAAVRDQHCPRRASHFTAPGFCYVFPLLKQGLTSSTARTNEAMMLNGLAIISQHAALRGDTSDIFSRDQLHPQLFPIDQMFRLLVDLIGSSSGRVAAASIVALLDTARCAARAPLSYDDVLCLLDGLQSPLEVVRDAALRALQCVAERLPPFLDEPECALNVTLRLYVASFDVSEDNKKLAEELWSRLPRAEQWVSAAAEELRELLLQQVQHPADELQRAAAAALAALVGRAPEPRAAADAVLQRLHQLYDEKLPLIPAVLDQFGHVQTAAVDAWGARRGVARALLALAPQLDAAAVPRAMAFFVQRALADRADLVRDTMLAAAMALVDLHGKETLSSQLPVFEQFLDTAPKSGRYDAVRQCVVLLVGSLARHLAPDDARVRPIALRLIAALSTPSQQVSSVFEQFLDTAPKSGRYDAVRQCVVLLVGSLARHLAPDDARVRPIALRLIAALSTPSQQVSSVFEQFLDTAPKSGRYDAVRQCVVLLVGSLARHLAPDDARVRPIALRLIAALSTPSQQVSSVFEQFLDTAPKSGRYDAVRQCVVLLVGSLARHLAPDDARVRPIALRLIAALSTPSQQVSSVFEQFLDTAPKSGRYDAVRQCVVLLVGSLARHLAPDDARVRPIALRLIAALSTPSQQVSSVFEQFLDTAPKSGRYDAVRQCVVLLVGSLARHLAPDDARVRPIALRLIAALSTPSQQVSSVFEQFLDTAPKSGRYDAVRQCVVLLVGSLARHLAPDDARVRPIALRLIAALSTPSQQVSSVFEQFLDTAPKSGRYDAVRQCVVLLVGSLARHLAPDDARVRPIALRLIAALSTPSQQVSSVFEQFLDTAPKSGRYDAVRQCVVLLVGSLARHLAPDDARVRPIALRLIAALSTPSQQVQEAVSNCLPHLVTSPALEDDIPGIVNKLLKQLLTADKYGDRKGAAYGIAGIIKGLGILSLKQLDVMGKLTEAIQEKKNYKYREGALFGFEMLCCKLGRLFEPYIVHVLPHLLLCFGDSSQYVRAAADDTAKLIMSRLSAHGVKLVLPSLLQALQDDNWRTKAGSIELLGAMAYCAPKQLSSCLPSIVPKLIEVLSDSHMRVQEAGAEALKVIGSVIRNPEIQAIVPVLLQALQDPSNKTSLCLQTLLDTKFVHFIDAPSLALIMPVVERAFLDRSTETRKMAAQIIGNMYSLTDQKDLTPYLPSIIPGLKSSLLDPVPEVRSVSARALGAMVRGMGEGSFEELLPWLMHTLTSESSSVDRSGAAQGLSEVVAGLGSHKLHKIMPDIIATAERTDIAPHVKDGYIMMFIYMPGAFTDEFLPYIGQIINPILKALADENEYVRETALKAGQRIVNLYAESAIQLLLPELERGLFDDNWRIRYSSVQLLGDLLYRISGVSGKMSTETASEDDNFGTEHSHKAIINALGPERRNRVLAGLYMGRSDVALMVRQAALHVWKVVVTNTPKTLREILPTLFNLLLSCLASTSYDKRQVAARTLGDLVKKLGERVLPDIVPILERGLRSERPDQRQGVCIGLGEILASTSRDAVLSFADGLVPTVRTALCDELPEVRMAAARAFDSLHATIGNKALDDILPPMLDGLRDPDPAVADATLDGLKQVMAIKSRAVLPYLVPVLTGSSGGGVDTRALSALAAAAGNSLVRHLPRVLPALLNSLVTARGTPAEVRELEYCRDALLPVLDDTGVRCIIDTLMECVRTGDAGAAEKRRAAAALLCAFVTHTRADLIPHVPALLRGLLLLFAETERDVLLMAWEALAALTKMLENEKQLGYVSEVRQAVRYAAADLKGEPLPGFCLPKGIAPILPLFREAILTGLPEEKENAALMLGEVIRLTTAAAIQPSVVHITGPLIRILGDRFNSSVKAAVLETLALLLSKVGVMLKQFLPQLQTTFVKGLYDANRPVRIKAGLALSQLVLIHTRADPLFLEVHNGVKNADDLSVKETMLQALRSVITNGGDKMSEQLALTVLAMLTCPALLAHPEDPPRSAAGGCLGALLHCLAPAHRDAALLHHVLAAGNPTQSSVNEDWLLTHGRSSALFVALKETPDQIYRDHFEEKIDKALLGYLASDKIPIVCNGIRGIGYLICYLLEKDRAVPPNILSQFVRSMNHSSNEVKQLMARASTLVGRSGALAARGAGADVLRALLPALVNGTKEKNTYVRSNSEIALRAVLRLPQDEAFHQQCMGLLEEGGREALGDVVTRVLRRAAADGRDEELDCTLVT